DRPAAKAKVLMPRGNKRAMQVTDEGFVGIALAAAELVIKMSKNERRMRGATQHKEGAEQGDAIRPARDGNHHPRPPHVKQTPAALDLDGQREWCTHDGAQPLPGLRVWSTRSAS